MNPVTATSYPQPTRSPVSGLPVRGLMRVRALRARYRGRSGVVSSLGKGRLRPCQELPWLPGDEACPALKGHVGPHSREHYEYTVTKSDEEEEVHRHPREPGREPRELEPPKIRDSRSTPDGC